LMPGFAVVNLSRVPGIAVVVRSAMAYPGCADAAGGMNTYGHRATVQYPAVVVTVAVAVPAVITVVTAPPASALYTSQATMAVP
jgi:hypothetical protein